MAALRDQLLESSIIPMTRRRKSSSEGIERYLIIALLSIVGFFATYTFYDFSETLKQVRSDVSSLQVSFASLSRHVEDEDHKK